MAPLWILNANGRRSRDVLASARAKMIGARPVERRGLRLAAHVGAGWHGACMVDTAGTGVSNRRTRRRGISRAIILDVDGVVSPVHPHRRVWGDEVVAGDVLGPVLVSPALCERLDALDKRPGVTCWWLTSWLPEMRHRMTPFPGQTWPDVGNPWDARGPRWWKMQAMATWLPANPEVELFAWIDDDLRGGRFAAARRLATSVGIAPPLLLAPKRELGLTPEHLETLEGWAR